MSDQDQVKSIAVLGTGLMGEPMAACLLNAGYSLTVWNRTAKKTRALVAKGAKVAASPADAAADSDMVITMLADGPAVGDVLFESGVASALSPNTLVVDMSSIPPATARDHSARLAKQKIQHLDAPVSGGTKGAAEGTLAIMAGGPSGTFLAAKPALEAMGRPIRVGPSGAGQLAKLANQTIVAVTIGAVSEALLLAAAGGADPAKVREALSGGFADSPILKLHGQRMLDRNFVPGGPTRMQVKDLRTILGTAEEIGLDLPVVKTVAALFEELLAGGFGECDHSALLLEIERRNQGKRLGTNPNQIPS
jgi:2-hydroxy-3-oxopropionate reductase